jgi:hypothetical protein
MGEAQTLVGDTPLHLLPATAPALRLPLGGAMAKRRPRTASPTGSAANRTPKRAKASVLITPRREDRDHDDRDNTLTQAPGTGRAAQRWPISTPGS